MLECVVNISEGRDLALVSLIAAEAGDHVLDIHSDSNHNRSVITMAGDLVEDAARAVTAAAFATLDVRNHAGAHPRLGVVDVVPFVPLAGSHMDDAVGARDRFLCWVAETFALPAFSYGPGPGESSMRSLPDVRRNAFGSLAPDAGPPTPHVRFGAVCVGARPPLVAYNVWLSPETDVLTARRVAAAVRGPSVRALGLRLGDRSQVSMNLIDPGSFGPMAAFDAVAAEVDVQGAELVGLVPASVLDAIPEQRWDALDLSAERTIEGRLAQLRTSRGH